MAFSLSIPEVDEIKKAVEQETQLDPQSAGVIADASQQKAEEILAVDLENFDSRKEIVQAIETFGASIIRKTGEKSSLMQVRVGDLSRAGGESGQVASGLAELALAVKDLDPSIVDFDSSGFLAKLVNPMKKYFAKFKSADDTIAEILKSLEQGASTLKKDNVTLEIEQRDLRTLTKQLAERTKMGEELDAYLGNALENYKLRDDCDMERVKFISEEILFPLRQRLMDFAQMLAVSQQGYVAMEVIRKNNLELIRSVERAQTVTISALRTAVTVASALYHQKIVLDKVNLVNAATNQLIQNTSKMLNTQGVEIQKQAMEASISVDTLKIAFAETLSALDAISEYKQAALPAMRRSITEFSEFAKEGEKAITRIEKGREQSFY